MRCNFYFIFLDCRVYLRGEKGRGEGVKLVTEGREKRNQEEGKVLHARSEEQQQGEHVLVFIDKL